MDLTTYNIAPIVVPTIPAMIRSEPGALGILGIRPLITSAGSGITINMVSTKQSPINPTKIARIFSKIRCFPFQKRKYRMAPKIKVVINGLKPLPDLVSGFDHSSTTCVTTDMTPIHDIHSEISREARTSSETGVPKWDLKLCSMVLPVIEV